MQCLMSVTILVWNRTNSSNIWKYKSHYEKETWTHFVYIVHISYSEPMWLQIRLLLVLPIWVAQRVSNRKQILLIFCMDSFPFYTGEVRVDHVCCVFLFVWVLWLVPGIGSVSGLPVLDWPFTFFLTFI